ncbi:MAG: hypothetical protein R3Y22_06800 [Bacteroidales bacterium]
MKRLLFTIILVICGSGTIIGYDYPARDCQGSLKPYPIPTEEYVINPDTLTPIFINHLGRHGSRYQAGSYFTMVLYKHFQVADSLNSITPLGEQFKLVIEEVIDRTGNRWGALSDLGIAEHQGIAERMYHNYEDLLKCSTIKAEATKSPRAIQSMFSFTHRLTELSNAIELTTTSGHCNTPELMYFEESAAYIDYIKGDDWKKVYNKYVKEILPTEPIKRLLGANYPFTPELLNDLALYEYYLITGMESMQMEFDYTPYMSLEELNSLWSIFSLRQYLQRTASTVSDIPADIAAPLLMDIVAVGDSVVNGRLDIQAQLRFAHAETLMPLFSLLRLDNCYYKTHYFDTVANHWCDFQVVPMSANLQIIYLKSDSGEMYVRFDMNEIPIILPGYNSVYNKWKDVRAYLLTCLPVVI